MYPKHKSNPKNILSIIFRKKYKIFDYYLLVYIVPSFPCSFRHPFVYLGCKTISFKANFEIDQSSLPDNETIGTLYVFGNAPNL